MAYQAHPFRIGLGALLDRYSALLTANYYYLVGFLPHVALDFPLGLVPQFNCLRLPPNSAFQRGALCANNKARD